MSSASVTLTIPKIVLDVLSLILPKPYIEWWVNLLHENPTHLFIETTLRPAKQASRRHDVTEDVLKERLLAFNPEPLAPESLSEEAKLALSDIVVVESAPSAATVSIKGRQVVSFASADFLDFGSSDEVRKATEDALNKYGVGSCGPRGFYGTIDAHVKLEEAIANFFNQSDSIIYSDSASTVASAIPAFANKSDLLIVDEGCNDNVFTGVKLSRAKYYLFKHNNMEDLERVMKEVEKDDVRLNRKPSSQRRFVVFEGLYRNSGDIAPLPAIYELKMKYKWRLICDECVSFGILGETGKGLTEHYKGQIPEDCVEILVGSLETTLASVGGFCVGAHEVVEHQRLAGAGYVFSASAPPFTCCAAQAALELLKTKKNLLKLLKEKAKFFSSLFLNDKTFEVISSRESPVVHLRFRTKFPSVLEEIRALRKVANRCVEEDSVLIIPTYYPDAVTPVAVRNTLRLYIHVKHETADLQKAADSIKKFGMRSKYLEDLLLLDDPPLITCSVIVLKDKRLIKDILNRYSVGIALLHCKRCRHDEINNTTQVLIESKEVDNAFATEQVTVPAVPPLTKTQAENWSKKFWPVVVKSQIDYASPPRFADGVVIEKWMKYLQDRHLWVIIVDNRTNTCVGEAALRESVVPWNHPVIVAINKVGSLIRQANVDSILGSQETYLCTGFDVFLRHEPCHMCAMALLHSRVARVFWDQPNLVRGALGSITRLHTLENINHRYVVYKGFFKSTGGSQNEEAEATDNNANNQHFSCIRTEIER